MASPSTPRSAIANSSKKRAPLTDLSRPSPGGSHGTKMAAIFQDAARSLEGWESPSSPCSSNIKRSRIPLSQAKSTPFGRLGQIDITSSSHWGSRTPIRPAMRGRSLLSTASTEVSHAAAPTPAEVPYGLRFPTPLPRKDCVLGRPTTNVVADEDAQVDSPVLDGWRSSQARSDPPGSDSEEGDSHSTHGVPLILPLHSSRLATVKNPSVHSWLKEVVTSSAADPPGTNSMILRSSPETVHNNQEFIPSTIPFTPPAQCSPANTKSLCESRSPLVSNNKHIESPTEPVSSSSSNKENQPPASPVLYPTLTPSSPRPTTEFLSANLSQFGLAPSPAHVPHPPKSRTLSTRSSSSPRRPPRTPPGQLTQPPKRQKAASTDRKSRAAPKWEPTSTFTIHEDETPQLSPEVEMFRKGKGRKAKRERCASYNDEDILGRGTGTEVEGAEEGEVVGNENNKPEARDFRKGRAVLMEMGKGLKMEKEKGPAKADERFYEFMVGGMTARKDNNTE